MKNVDVIYLETNMNVNLENNLRKELFEKIIEYSHAIISKYPNIKKIKILTSKGYNCAPTVTYLYFLN